MGGDGCVGVPISLCVCVCVQKKGGGIHFSKAQALCMPPSMFGLLLCICRGGEYLRQCINFSQVHINAGDSLIFNVSNIKRKIKLKN